MNPISSKQALDTAQINVIANSRRSLAIRTPSLALLPQSDELYSTLITLIKGYKNCRIRVLYDALDNALEQQHLFIQLRRKTATFVQLRQASEFDRGQKEQVWLGDRHVFLHQPDTTRPTATLDLFAKSKGPNFLERFNAAWERGKEDVSLREVLI